MPSSAFRLIGLACFLTAATSCTISSNARRSAERTPQANDPVTGGASLAGTAFRSTAIAAIREPVTTVKLGAALLWHRPREVVVSSIPVEFVFTPPPSEIPGTRDFERMLDREGFPEAEKGSIRWLVDGKGFFPELETQIASARKSIDIQVFIFDNDDIAVKYADLLKARSKDVAVRVLSDDLGSTYAQMSPPETPAPPGFVAPRSITSYLKQNSEVRARRVLNPWLVSDHTKLMVFDGRSAMLGGMNIGREYYSEWHDLMALVEGPIVASLAADFTQAWRKAGPMGDFSALRAPAFFKKPRPTGDDIPLRILRTDPAAGRYEILKSTLMGIRAARKRIWIQNPYFAHDDIALALQTAARRGVDVRVILPERGDSTIMDAGNLATARGLINAGVKVYRHPRMTHMKVMLCDGWGTMGSANLDTLSMRINRELNLAFRHPDAISSLEKAVFRPDFRVSRRMKVEDTRSGIAPLAEIIADQL